MEKIFISEKKEKEFSKWLFKYDNMKEKIF